jgi:raffinose/stachyose/melibiose transport system substrate-binding protein
MKNKKKLVCALLVVLMVTSLFAGCSTTSTKSSSSTTSSSKAQKLTLTVYSMENLKAANVNDYFSDFEKQNNVTIKNITFQSAQFVQSFSVAMSAGAQADVLLLNGQDVRSFANNGLIDDLTTSVNYQNRFLPNAVSQYEFNGKLYALPWSGGNTSGVYYNKDILSKYKLQPPTTLADLVSDTSVLKKAGIATFAFGGGSIYMWPMWFMDVFQQTTGGKAVADTEATLAGTMKFTDPAYVQAMSILGELGTGNMFQTGFNGANSAAGETTFEANKAAFFFGGTWEIGTFTSAGMTNIGVVPFPVVVNGATSGQVGAAGGGGAAIYSKAPAANKSMDLKLLDYVTSDAKAMQISNWDGDAYSPNTNAKLTQSNPLYTTVNSNLVPSTFGFLDWIWPAALNTVIQQQIQAVTGGKTTAAAAMAAVQKEYNTEVSNGYVFGKAS